jgi:hypothetical protein
MKRILVLLIFIMLSGNIIACEICGCSSGNYFIGPYPQFSKHFIGIRYSFRNFKTVISSDNTEYSNDFYQTAELLAGTNIGSRWQMLLFAPYNINYSESDDGISRESGLGDMTFFGNYKLFNNKTLNADTNTVSQQLWIGGGLKVPTGRFEVDSSELVTSANSQPGTGSFDYILTGTYMFQVGNWGINSNASYKINGSAQDFKFGNRFTANAFIFRSFSAGMADISPNAGLLFENLRANKNKGEEVEETGGNALLMALGLESRMNRILIGFNVQLPAFSDISAGQTEAKVRGMVHLSYVL